MLHDKVYWLLIILLSIPFVIYMGIHIAFSQILLTEPTLAIGSVIIKIFKITDEGLVTIIKASNIGFWIYSAFTLLLSSLFAIISTKSEEEYKRPWKYPFLIFLTIFFVFLVNLSVKYYINLSYKNAIRNHLASNNIIQNVQGTNIDDLAYSRKVLQITFSPLSFNLKYNKLIMEMTVRDNQGNVIGYTPIKMVKTASGWEYKDMLFDKPLKTQNGQVKTQTVLYEDKKVLAKLISITIKDANPISQTFNKTIVAKDVVIKYEKNPFVK